jgi:phage terminase small subunit
MINEPKKPKQEIIKGDLNERHKLFAIHYLKNGFNATLAYTQTYKKIGATAEVNGCKLLGNTKIQEYLRIEQENMKLSNRITLESQLKELEELKALARVPDEKGRSQLSVATKAVEIQNKMLGLDAPTKLELTGKDGGALQVETIIKKIGVEE